MSYYSVNKIDDMETLHSLFPSGQADTMNWFFAGTSGVHGSATRIDGLSFIPDDDGFTNNKLTVMVIKPRICSLLYGHIEVTADKLPFLRGLVRSTLASIEKSQRGNV